MSKPATYNDISSATAGGAMTLSLGNTIKRVEALPLDKYSVFPNYSEASAYAAGTVSRYEGLAYEGQVIAVSSEAGQQLYVVDGSAPNYLKEIANGGGVPAEHTHYQEDIDGLTDSLSGLSSGINLLSGQVSDISSSLGNKAEKNHGHGINTITNLRNELNNKASVDHLHDISSVNNLQQTLDYIAQAAAGGGGGGGESVIGYTVNGKFADASGNFQINREDIGAAADEHEHEVSAINGLSAELSCKADADHTHEMVTGITIGGNTLTGNVQLSGIGNVEVEQVNNNIQINVTPFTADKTNSILDPQSGDAYKIFVGTEQEWAAFKETLPDDSRYLVFLRS